VKNIQFDLLLLSRSVTNTATYRLTAGPGSDNYRCKVTVEHPNRERAQKLLNILMLNLLRMVMLLPPKQSLTINSAFPAGADRIKGSV